MEIASDRGFGGAGVCQAGIRGVAERAGVSISTVSRFLNGKKRVTEETAARIRSAVGALGYAPNPVARSLRAARTTTVGLVVPDWCDPYFADVAKGAEEAAREAGYEVLLFSSGGDREREQEQLRTLAGLRGDGAIVIPARRGPEEPGRWLPEGSLTLVCVDGPLPLAVDMVAADNRNGGYEATRHLIQSGHRR